MTTATSAMVSFTVTSNAAPAWFVSATEKQWVAISSNTLNDVAGPSPTTGGSFALLTRAWTGGCVDQSRGELLFPANGGHMDYAGNQVFACSVKSESPQWYRLTDASPESAVSPPVNGPANSTANTIAGQGHNPSGYTAMYSDGRMRALHHANGAAFANNKIWFHTQSSPSGIGNSTSHAWSYNRVYTGIPTAPGAAALAWANNPGPWAWLGTSSGGETGSSSIGDDLGPFAPSALDPVTGLIWTAHTPNAARVWASLNTSNGSIVRCNSVNVSADSTSQGWACVVYDPAWDGINESSCRWRYWVANDYAHNALVILNLKAADPYAAAAWTYYVPTSSTVHSAGNVGAVYHAPSKSILLGNPSSLGGNILKVRVPTNGDGTYAGGTWQVSTITLGGSNPATGLGGDNQGAYSKFNIINDMGNGQAALVVCMETNQAVYACKLPTTEIS